MKRTKLFAWLTYAFSLLPFCSMAQTYEQLWRNIDRYAKKDLPSSVIATADKIYSKGQAERNIPQMMKAYIVRAEYRGALIPDSLDSEKLVLKQWAKAETDLLGRAVLNSIVGTMFLDGKNCNVSEAVRYFRLSIVDKDLLTKTSAKEFMPMTKSGTLSEKYFGDNMFDLLVRQAIRSLSNSTRYNSLSEMETAFSFYDDLISFYEAKGDRVATFLCKESKLVFRYEKLDGFTKFHSAVDEKVSQLISLASQYKGLPVCADAYLKAALYYMGNDEKAKAVDVAQRALKEYPKGDWAADLNKVIEQAKRTLVDLSIPFVYPEYNTEIKVSFANANAITLELYRLNLSPSSKDLSENKWDYLLKKYGKRVSVTNYSLIPSDGYEQRDTTFGYTLPQAGIYVMKQVSHGIKKNTLIDYSLLYVSPYQCIVTPVSKNKREVIVIDRLTGHPVPGAELVEYDCSSYEYLKTYKTNENGSVLLSDKARHSYFNARTSGNDFMALSYMGGNFYMSGASKSGFWDKKATLFTDRSIYRPGQTVHVSGLLFEQKGDSVQVRTDKTVEFKLCKEGQTAGNFKATSDDFGVLSGDFILPQSLLSGRYVISGGNASVAIDIEEYKRPTFDVKFMPYTATYAMGDSIYIQGEAKTFAGVPVRNAKVKFRFARFYRWWYRWNKQNETKLEEGEVLTDSDGQFTVKVMLKAPDNLDWGDKYSPCFYDYQLTVDVTNDAGETQSKTMSLPVSNQSLYLSVQNMDDIVMREKYPSIRFRALNIDNQPVETVIKYRIYQYKTGKLSNKGELKYMGEAEAQRSFVPTDMWNLPSGKYIIELSATDDKGNKCMAEKTFTLFSKTDRQVPDASVAWFYQDGDKFEDGNIPVFYVGTREPDVYLLIDIYSNQQRIESQRIKLDNELRAFPCAYKAEYGDGVLMNIAFVRKGSLYNYSARFVRPKPQKELTMTWETFRDKLHPGDKEEWRMHISDHTGSPVKANLMAVLYDASLDKLHPHNWNFGLYFPRLLPSVRSFQMASSQVLNLTTWEPYIDVGNGLNLIYYPAPHSLGDQVKSDYTSLFGFGGFSRFYYWGSDKLMRTQSLNLSVRGRSVTNIVAAEASVAPMFKEALAETEARDEVDYGVSEGADDESTISIRENFAETAFFYPQLRTDSLGDVTIAFIVPESLTEWKFMGFAHTPYLDYGILTDKSVAQKQFMVQPNMPRFVRRGDKTTIAASLVNMAAQAVSGIAHIELSDPMTGKVVYKSTERFSVDEGQTGTIRFGFDIPQKYDVLVCKITASAGKYSDGEQHYLPVLTDKQWVTESLAVQVDDDESTTIQTKALFNGQSKTATEHRLTLEMTANPDWYAVQALPVAGNPQTEDALSWATAYYANSLASLIIEANPHIKQVFSAWVANGGDKETFIGGLERNQDLKNMLLRETPWLTEATDETEQKRRIALLFDLNAMHSHLNVAIGKLISLQNADGAWSWYKGMSGSRYVTTQIVEELARLKTMGVTLDKRIGTSYIKAVKYLALCAEKDYEEMRRIEKKSRMSFNKALLDEQTIHYLYICALDSDIVKYTDTAVNDYFLAKLEDRSADYTIYGKSLVAIIMQGAKRTRQAVDLVRSVKEYSVYTKEMGRYFDTGKAYYSWRNYKIPTEVAAMEAIYRVSPDEKMLNEMKQWLLRQKQVQMWESSIATADAVYAFLSMNGNKLKTVGKMKAVVGKFSYVTPDDALGYIRKTLTGCDTKVASIQMEKTGGGVGWGAIYAQCREDIDKLSDYKGEGVSITRNYMLNGEHITSGSVLHIGDKLTIRLTVKADRDMDFIQIKDDRAACMEPTEQLSGYWWKGGWECYRVSNDASTCFFIDRMTKGTHQIEYTVYIDRVGTYQAGVATVQSAYSPEFGGHSSGFTVKVE